MRMMSLINDTIENGKLAPEISYPSKLAAELLVPFSFLADFLRGKS